MGKKTLAVSQYFVFPTLEDIFHLWEEFDTVVISHVYRNNNVVANALSKGRLHLTLGQWHITEFKEEETHVFYHRPFIEALGQPHD